MEFLVVLLELGVGEVSVDLCGGDVFVSKEFLDVSEISVSV